MKQKLCTIITTVLTRPLLCSKTKGNRTGIAIARAITIRNRSGGRGHRPAKFLDFIRIGFKLFACMAPPNPNGFLCPWHGPS